MSYVATAPDTGVVTVPARIRTRGIWRLKNCEFPPIRINFTNEAVKGTAFRGLDEPKLVNYCRNNDDYEQYILQEFQLYRIYRLLTPVSHAVRLMHLTYADSATGKEGSDAVRVHRRAARRARGAHRRQDAQDQGRGAERSRAGAGHDRVVCSST